jgi:HSP20 family molecular chaperone IbpA
MFAVAIAVGVVAVASGRQQPGQPPQFPAFRGDTERVRIEAIVSDRGHPVTGLKAEDLNIQILEDVVTLEGEFKSDESEYLLRELPHGSFRRSLQLPAAVDAEKVEAKIVDGLLTLRLPKAETARPKKIKIAEK